MPLDGDFQGISLSLTVPNEAEADRRFNALADGGQVQMPLTKPSFRRALAWWPTASA
jgi:PhnB protein